MRAPKLIALITFATAVPLGMLFWLGVRLLDQDRRLEAQDQQQKLERSAELVVSALQRAILQTQQGLAADPSNWPAGAVEVVVREDRISAHPATRVAFFPVVPSLGEVSSSVFAEAERLEFQDQDQSGAVRAYTELDKSADPAVRAGALLRLGRNLPFSEAQSAFRELSKIEAVAVSGVPASLIGIWAGCRLLEASGRWAELNAQALELETRLHSGRWTLTEPVYRLYAADAAKWTNSPPGKWAETEMFGEAVGHLWKTRGSIPATLVVQGQTLTIVRQSAGETMRALIVTPQFVDSQWLAPAQKLASIERISFTLSDAAGIRRHSSDTGLPWNVSVRSGRGFVQDQSFVFRRRLVTAGFLLVVVMTAAAGYLIFRGVTREVAAANMQSDFVAAVSHEFRTPLTTLHQFTTMLKEKHTMGEERRMLCYEAQSRATERLMRLVESLLDFGRMEAGAYQYHFGLHDCTALVRRALDDFRSSPSASERIGFEADGPADAEVDAEALARAVRNLVENALKYSPDEKAVQVKVTRTDSEVRIGIIDRGIGIPPNEQAAVFRKFQRGEHARNRGIHGTGLGLTIVQEIVRAHAGRVELKSNMTSGTTFTIVLPAKV